MNIKIPAQAELGRGTLLILLATKSRFLADKTGSE